ncbi:transposon Ty3-I Gag-Pol polyprotein [Trichonephila clavata]|uniref:Transposon Ty3-I Gag-Pol polyprotein n=1 Tax=Trichonephila clavata TaxID=2740835 RepID=A0A8X6H3M7_TRICU|nr:transposon Ty3-I Gag-Pol polyprotein [Trichonephila clavata]
MLADKVSKLKFLVDTGADVSVLPKHYAPKADSSNELLLLAANGTKIATFGKKRLTLDLNLRRNFTWSFIIANVNQPIIGLDFLKHYNLLVDVKSGCLIDGITKLTTQGKYTNRDSLTSGISILLGDSEFYNILSQFQDLTNPSQPTKNKVPTKIHHFIETTGQPTQASLHELLKNSKKNDKRPVPWTDLTTEAFEKCKADIANAATLNFHSPNQQLSIMVDASDSAIGSVLHTTTSNGQQPLAFYSRKLTPSECKYSKYDRELLAIYATIKHFRHLLEGQNFIIFTDHRPLTFAFTKKSDSSSLRQLRYLDFIAQFSTDTRHVSGSKNVVADTLSRINEVHLPKIDFSAMAEAQASDEELQAILGKNELHFF